MSIHRRLSSRHWLLQALVGCGLAWGAAGTSSFADESISSTRELAMRVSVAESEADRLSEQISAMSARPHETKVADLFGESDEEKAARLQHEQAQDSSIATLNQRVGDLEQTLRGLTGQVEQLDHRLSELSERLTRMQKDFDYKLCALSAQQLGASTDSGDESGLPCSAPGQQSGMVSPSAGGIPPQAASREPIHLAPPPGVLGTLPHSDFGHLPEPSSAPPDELASIDTRPQFESALNMLAKAQYEEARAAFRGFADTYPRDDLAPQAIYWVGDIAFVQKDYAGAARAFAEEIKKYPASPRAPESLLKLGQSLIAMNQKKEGCTALGALASRYPSASKSVTDQALTARKTAGCR